MTFQESDLQFYFDNAHWRVMKYDAHRYYKILSGAGLKGVDFIGIHNKKQLVFFEVKHFRSPKVNSKENEALFIQQIYDKMEDTITAIQVIEKLLNRKRWYRYFLKLESYIPFYFVQNRDWYFWHRIIQLWKVNSSNDFVLWVEIAPSYSKLGGNNFRKKLQEKLAIEFSEFKIQPILASIKNPIFKKDLNVKREPE